MREVLYIAAGATVGLVVGLHIRAPSGAHCCSQLEQLVRAEVRKRCGSAADFCEGLGGALGLFDNSSAFLDLFGVTT